MDMLIASCFILIAFCVMMYVLLDGFDLGIGILFPFFRKKEHRDTMMTTILPVWDGNQTWLVLGGAFLFGGFPLAFSLLLPAFYLPLFIMILALLFRGITFEFRLKAKRGQRFWDIVFFISSTVVTLCQGLILGTFVKGFSFLPASRIFHYQLLTPFNITCSVVLLFGYALLGSTWTIAKTTGELQTKMYKVAFICLMVGSMALFIISLWTPFMDKRIWDIWFAPEHIYKLAILPFVTGCVILYFLYCLYQRYERILFPLTLCIFICSYIGFGISTWPYLIPPILRVWDAAAPDSTLIMIVVGAVILLPILLGYTFYSYYIFRGKVKEIIQY